MVEPLVTAGLGLLGLILGSFVATLVVRWPQGRSVVGGRSSCDACGRFLQATELVPVVSFVALHGRCRTCGRAIDRRHLVIEAAAALVGVAAGVVAPDWQGLVGAAFGWLLLTLAALDIAAWWLPDRLTGLLAIGGLVTGFAGLAPLLADRMIGGVAGFASLWLIGATYRRFRQRDGMGGGDPKLFGAIGLWLGWQLLPAVLLVACLIGLGIAGWRQVSGRPVSRGDAMPLGAMLAIAAYPAWLIMVASQP